MRGVGCDAMAEVAQLACLPVLPRGFAPGRYASMIVGGRVASGGQGEANTVHTLE